MRCVFCREGKMRHYKNKVSDRIGVESTSRDGKKAIVVNYATCENFIVRFADGKEIKLKNWKQFVEGKFNYKNISKNQEIVTSDLERKR